MAGEVIRKEYVGWRGAPYRYFFICPVCKKEFWRLRKDKNVSPICQTCRKEIKKRERKERT